MSKGKKTSTSTQTSAPPSWATGGYKNAVSSAQNLFNGPAPQYFQGNTVADFSPQSEQALSQITALAGNNPIIDAGQREALKTINGEYLTNNPYLSKVIDNASRDFSRNFQTAVLPGVDSAFTGKGRYGSGSWANAQDSAKANLATELGDISTNINYNNYNTERGYQVGAVNNAGALDAMKYMPAQALAGVGAARDNQAQQKINAELEKYNYTRDLPTSRLNQFIDQLNGATGKFGTQTGTQTQPGGSFLQGLAGVATTLGGAYLGNPAMMMGGLGGMGGGGMSAPPPGYQNPTSAYTSFGPNGATNWNKYGR